MLYPLSYWGTGASHSQQLRRSPSRLAWDASAGCQVYRADEQLGPEIRVVSQLGCKVEPPDCLNVQALAVIDPRESSPCRATGIFEFAALARPIISSSSPPNDRMGGWSRVSEIDIGLWSCLCTVTTWPVDVTHMARYSRDQEFAPIPLSRTAYGLGWVGSSSVLIIRRTTGMAWRPGGPT